MFDIPLYSSHEFLYLTANAIRWRVFVLCRTLVLMLTAAYYGRSTPNARSGFFFLRFSSASLFHSKRFAQNLNVPFIPSHF